MNLHWSKPVKAASPLRLGHKLRFWPIRCEGELPGGLWGKNSSSSLSLCTENEYGKIDKHTNKQTKNPCIWMSPILPLLKHHRNYRLGISSFRFWEPGKYIINKSELSLYLTFFLFLAKPEITSIRDSGKKMRVPNGFHETHSFLSSHILLMEEYQKFIGIRHTGNWCVLHG